MDELGKDAPPEVKAEVEGEFARDGRTRWDPDDPDLHWKPPTEVATPEAEPERPRRSFWQWLLGS